MEIAQHHHGAVAVIQPVGPLTQEDADELKSRMMEVRRRSRGRLVRRVVAAEVVPVARRDPEVAAARSACVRVHHTEPLLSTACRSAQVRTAVIS